MSALISENELKGCNHTQECKVKKKCPCPLLSANIQRQIPTPDKM